MHGLDDPKLKPLSCRRCPITWWLSNVGATRSTSVRGCLQGCARLRLDSGLQRLDAHRFYEANGLKKSCYHFNCQLDA